MLDVLCVRLFVAVVVAGYESTHVLIEGENESSRRFTLFFVFVSTEGTMSERTEDEGRGKKGGKEKQPHDELERGKKQLLIGFRLSWAYWLTEITELIMSTLTAILYRVRSKVEWMFSSLSEESSEKLNEKFPWMITQIFHDFPTLRMDDVRKVSSLSPTLVFSLDFPTFAHRIFLRFHATITFLTSKHHGKKRAENLFQKQCQ